MTNEFRFSDVRKLISPELLFGKWGKTVERTMNKLVLHFEWLYFYIRKMETRIPVQKIKQNKNKTKEGVFTGFAVN